MESQLPDYPNMKSITGFDWIDDVSKIDSHYLYGYAFCAESGDSEDDDESAPLSWQCYAGSFSHVYGIYKGVMTITCDKDDVIHHVFYRLKGKITPKNKRRNHNEYTPVELITHAFISDVLNEDLQQSFLFNEDGMVMNSITLRDLSTRFEKDEDDPYGTDPGERFPSVNFTEHF